MNIAEIRIEAKNVDPFLSGHLYLVGVADTGAEFVIRGGPQFDSLTGNFGNIVTEVGRSIANSEDFRPAANRSLHGSTVLDFGDRDANDPANPAFGLTQHEFEYQYVNVVGSAATHHARSIH